MSFSAAVAKYMEEVSPGPPHRPGSIVATTLHPEPAAISHARSRTFIREPVDATRLHMDHSAVANSACKCDYIVFTFPHTGTNQSTNLQQSVHDNRALLHGFFLSLEKLNLGLQTKIHVTLKETKPYTEWGLLPCAARHGFVCVRKFPFTNEFYQGRGYNHETTKKNLNQNGLRVDISSAHTYEFVRR